MDYGDSAATLAWVSMNRRVSRWPASAQIPSRLGPLQFEVKRRRVDAFHQRENKGIGVSRLKKSRHFTKTKRKTQRGQRNVRVYFRSRGVPVGTRSWRRKMSTEDRRKRSSHYMEVEGSWAPKSQLRRGTTCACLRGLYRPKIKSNQYWNILTCLWLCRKDVVSLSDTHPGAGMQCCC